jgi:ABC-2 type transport system permease protein
MPDTIVVQGPVVAARIGVTIMIALVQMVIFIGLAVGLFGLTLSGSWWMAGSPR